MSDTTSGEILPIVTAIFDVLSVNPHCQITGVVGIVDCQGLTMRHFLCFVHPSMQIFIACLLQECYPWRIKRVFFINCNSVLKTAFAAFRYLMKKKIVDRIRMLGSDLTELHEYLNPAILPKEYGGTLEESECSITGIIMDNMDYLKYDRSFGLKSSSKSH